MLLARKNPDGFISQRGRLSRVEKAVKGPRGPGVPSAADRLHYESAYLVPQDRWRANPGYTMMSSPLDRVWERIAQYPTIEPCGGKFFNGVQPGKIARPNHFVQIKDANENPPGSGWRKVLYKNDSTVLRPFRINWTSQRMYMLYPSPHIFRPRDPAHFTVPAKVVLNATRNANSHWRFYAAVDVEQLVVTENFHYAIPAPGVSAKLLAGLLNSMLANAWFSSRNVQRDVNLDHLRQMPFPPLTDEQTRGIEDIVDRIEAERSLMMDYGQLPAMLQHWILLSLTHTSVRPKSGRRSKAG